MKIPTTTSNRQTTVLLKNGTGGVGTGTVAASSSSSGDQNQTSLEEGMSLEQIICEDLKAFENRLVEIIQTIQPPTNRWRWTLGICLLCTLIGTSQWLLDPETFQVSFIESLLNHKFFAISAILLIALFCGGIHRRVIAPNIISSRVRRVIAQFNMSCDESGRLILMPRPNYFHNNNANNHNKNGTYHHHNNNHNYFR